LHDVLPRAGGNQARGESEGDGMISFTEIPKEIQDAIEKSAPSRRDFLKASGLLVVGFGVAPFASAGPLPAQGGGPYPDPDFRQLDSWIVIRADNTATFYVGKTDLGQGTGTAFRPLLSGELDTHY